MPTIQLEFELRGGNAEAWSCLDREILVEGPRGTGKTRTILELLNAYCHRYPGIRILIAKKYLRSIGGSVSQTYLKQVVQNGEGITPFGGNEFEPAAFRYKNGSAIVLGGLDDPEKLKSSEYSIIYVNEATELTEEDWDALKALLRQSKDGKLIISHPRIIGDCNPTDAGHWLNRRCEAGDVTRIKTRLRDNPHYFIDDETMTEAGEDYINGTLESYKGSRRKRWLDGEWTGVEDACYQMFDPLIHIQPIEPGLHFVDTIIGEDYGNVHLCAVAAVSIDQYNRRWVREVWAGEDVTEDPEKPSRMDLVVKQFKDKYAARRGRVDPNQAKLAKLHGFNIAKGGSGGRAGNPRLKRVDDMALLFYTYEGGRVPTRKQVAQGKIPRGPFAEKDSRGIYLVEGAPGIAELAAEIDQYHFIYIESDLGRKKDVHRENENRIAAVEYANEEWEEGEAPPAFPTSVPSPSGGRSAELKNPFFKKRRSPASEWKLH